jgi:protein MpaA
MNATTSYPETELRLPHSRKTDARDYHKLAKRIEVLAAGEWRGELGGLVSGYPFFVMSRQVAPNAPTILLTGGMHGDEPAGVEAALQWMEGDDWRPWPVNWLVLPCINPFGWIHDQRINADGQDINRHFLDSDRCPEAALVRRVLGQQRFLLAMDIHEDSDSDGYYLCETKVGPPFLGERIPQALAGLMPVAESPLLDGRRAQGPGWVLRLARRNAFKRRRRWPLAFHLTACCTDHFLCSETPTHLSLDLRVRVHLKVLEEALRFTIEPLEPSTESATLKPL